MNGIVDVLLFSKRAKGKGNDLQMMDNISLAQFNLQFTRVKFG